MENPITAMKLVMSIIKSDYMTLGAAGVAGAIVSAVAEWRGWASLLQKVVVGGISAMYLSDLMIPILAVLLRGLTVSTDRADELSAFLVGMMGIVMFEFLTHLFRSYSAKMRGKADG